MGHDVCEHKFESFVALALGPCLALFDLLRTCDLGRKWAANGSSLFFHDSHAGGRSALESSHYLLVCES